MPTILVHFYHVLGRDTGKTQSNSIEPTVWNHKKTLLSHHLTFIVDELHQSVLDPTKQLAASGEGTTRPRDGSRMRGHSRHQQGTDRRGFLALLLIYSSYLKVFSLCDVVDFWKRGCMDGCDCLHTNEQGALNSALRFVLSTNVRHGIV